MDSHKHFSKLDCNSETGRWVAERCTDQAIIHAGLDASIGDNIQGPSLIRVPDWVSNPLGKYYLYFADHKGSYIRLAYSDDLFGPWQIHKNGSLHLRDSCFPTEPIERPPDYVDNNVSKMTLLHSQSYERSTPHIASPDVHVDNDNQQIIMYFHGLEGYGVQRTRLATSEDGLNFTAEDPLLCSSYLRVVQFQDRFIGVVMPGVVFDLRDLRGPFEDGVRIFPVEARHHALLVNEHRLFIFWTEVGDAPEHIKASVVSICGDSMFKNINHLEKILEPDLEWEGALEPNEPSVRSVAYGRVNQLRDPCIFVENEQVYLLYAGGGENAIGIAKLHWRPNDD